MMDELEQHRRTGRLRETLARLEREQSWLGYQSPVHMQLLPGEGSSVDDAAADHWASVYRELIRFKQGLIKGMRQRARGSEPGLAAEVLREARRLQPELERLSVHQSFWESQGRAR